MCVLNLSEVYKIKILKAEKKTMGIIMRFTG